MGSKRAVQAKLGMYLLAASLAAALFGAMRVLARWGGRVRMTAFLTILRDLHELGDAKKDE